MSWRETLATIACLSVLCAVGCGGGLPPEETVYYDPALRPGVVETIDPADREILVRLAGLAEAGVVDLAGRTVTAEAPYSAASGRRCRRIQDSDRARLACESSDRSWVFVPDVIATESGGRE